MAPEHRDPASSSYSSDDEEDEEGDSEEQEGSPGDDSDDEDYQEEEEAPLLKQTTAAAAAGLGESSSSSSKRKRLAAAVTQGAADGALPGAGADDEQGEKKGLEEKSEAYWYLRQEVQALEAEYRQPAGMFDAAFLKMEDAKATMLDDKVKRQRLAESKVMNQRWDIKKQVAGMLYNSWMTK